jgi:hypothetical protein
MPPMRSDRLRNLPYLVHTNRELGLMLKGIKPLAYFSKIPGRDPDCLVRYWRMFDRHVTAGRLIRREFVKLVSQEPQLEVRALFYCLPGEEWRIEAMRALTGHLGAWSREKERRFGELLGYQPWQNDLWLNSLPHPA